jgi:hypothetical protein
MRRSHLLIIACIISVVTVATSVFAYLSLNSNPTSEEGTMKVEWQQYLQGYSGDQIIQAPDGGYLAVGTNDTQNSIGVYESQTVIHKIDSSGNLQWTKYILLENGYDTRLTHAVKTEGGYLLAGSSEVANPSGGYGYTMQACLFNIDEQGNILWQKTYDALEAITAVTQTSDGGYAMAGSLGNASPIQSFKVMKVDSQGNVLWLSGDNSTPLGITFGFSGSAKDIFQTSDGGYVTTGTAGHHGLGGSPIEVYRLNPEGDHVWDKTYFGEGDFYSTSVSDSLALSDGYLLVGNTGAQGGQSNGYVFKIDLKGNALWNRTYTYLGETSSITSVSAAGDGFMFLGYAVPNPQGPASDTWVATIDQTGKVLDQLTIPMGNHRSSPTSLIQTTDGSHVFVGIWNQTDSLDQKIWVAVLTK